MDVNKVAAVEALLFTAEKPVALVDIANTIDVTIEETREYLDRLGREYNQKKSHGIKLEQYEDSYIFVTKSHLAPYIKKLHDVSQRKRLTQASLETLAIIAYKQPVTRSEIEEIRGVKVERTLRTLSKYDLIQELGRKDTTGNPIEYGTSKEFLRQFDLNSLSELPQLEDIEIEKEKQAEIEEEMLEKELNEDN